MDQYLNVILVLQDLNVILTVIWSHNQQHILYVMVIPDGTRPQAHI